MCSPTECPMNCAVRIHLSEDPRAAKVCVCDPDADRLAALVTEGIDQHTASLMLWSPERLVQPVAS